MIFLESVWGCLRDCPTKCGGWGNRSQFMPSETLNSLILEAKNEKLENIQLYGRGDVNKYPFEELSDIKGCEIAVTDISYYLVGKLRNMGAVVYSRIDKPGDVKIVPESDGYFTVQVPLESFFEVLHACLSLRPFAVKSLDSHMDNTYAGYDLRATGFPYPYNNPTSIKSYTIPSSDCRIPLVTHFRNKVWYKQCVSGEEVYKPYKTMKGLMADKDCKDCSRYPKQKRIYYYEN